MKDVEPLSPEEQEQAKHIYNRAIWVAMPALAVVLDVAAVLATEYLGRIGVPLRSGYVIGSAHVASLYLSMFWAMSQVRRAGLSRASRIVESIPKIASNFDSVPVQWHYTQRKVWALSLLFIGIAMSILLRSIAPRYMSRDIFSILLAAGSVCCISGVYLPILRFDKQGVSTFGILPWARRIAWTRITECEVTRCLNYLGETVTWTFNFKDEKGKSLLFVSPVSMLGFPDQKFQEMEAELRRWMTR